MPKLILPAVRKKAYLSVFVPGCIIFLTGLALQAGLSGVMGKSLWAGGLMWIIPQFYVSLKLFGISELNPEKFIQKFYRSESVKLLLTAVIFIGITRYFPVNIIMLITGYLCAQIFFLVIFFYNNFF